MEQKIQQALAQIQACIDAGPYSDQNWDNFEQYRVPQWYRDGKLGIFIHWGVYAVPAHVNEWYPRQMYLRNQKESGGCYEHHLKTYGPHDQFGYKDFIPLFKAEKYDAAEWAELFKESGACFVMPVAEHHDGFAMYDTEFNPYNAAKMGPCRDTTRELEIAVRERGMHFAVSSHREEHCWFFNGGMEFPSDVQNLENRAFYGPALKIKHEDGKGWVGELPDQAWLDDWLVRTCELVDKFKPEVVFFDWWIEEAFYAKALLKFAAYYYNRCAEWGIEGGINYKNEAMPPYAGIYDVERGQLAEIRYPFWQTDTSLAYNSWCYVEGMEYRTAGALIHDFIDIVSKNGALLINVGPRADGTIPEEQQHLLRELGAWLNVNGEAVYGSKPWKIYGEGPTKVEEGMFAEKHRQDFGAEDIRFTTNGGILYATFMGWPESGVVTIKNFYQYRRFCPLEIKKIEMLGISGELEFSRDYDGLHVTLPENRPCEHAWALKLTPA